MPQDANPAESPLPPGTRITEASLAAVLDDGDVAVAAGRLDLLPELSIRFHLGVADLSGSASLTALLRQRQSTRATPRRRRN